MLTDVPELFPPGHACGPKSHGASDSDAIRVDGPALNSAALKLARLFDGVDHVGVTATTTTSFGPKPPAAAVNMRPGLAQLAVRLMTRLKPSQRAGFGTGPGAGGGTGTGFGGGLGGTGGGVEPAVHETVQVSPGLMVSEPAAWD